MASKRKASTAATVQAGATFRKLAETEKPFVLPGVHDGLSARLAELAGFRGVFMGGFASLGARHAVPDVGLLGLADTSAIARDVRAVTSLPFMVDADDGYGDAKNVIHTVRTYERLGAQVIFLEDHVSPEALWPSRGQAYRVRGADGGQDSSGCGRAQLAVHRRAHGCPLRGWHGRGASARRALSARWSRRDLHRIAGVVAELEQCGRAFRALNMTSMLEGGKTPILKPSDLYARGSTP